MLNGFGFNAASARRSVKIIRRVAIGIMAISVFLTGCMFEKVNGTEWNVQVGDAVPEFSLKDTSGKVVSSESLKGKPYAIAIFATWCPPCKTELAALEEQVWQPLKDQGVMVIGIDFGDESSQLIQDFAKENDITFPMLVDEAGSFRKEAGVSMVPQSLVIGPDGKIMDLHVGYTDEGIVSIREVLESAL